MLEGGAEVLLAFDFGLRRIGIAVGDTVSGTAGPRPALRAGPAGPDWTAIDRQLREIRPQRLIVGIPLNVDGSRGRLSAAADRFAAALQRRSNLPVERVDERWSSLEAAERLRQRRQAGMRRRVQAADIDSTAAAIILERWLAGEGNS